MRRTPYAQIFHNDDGAYITARSKSGLINKAKACVRNGEANQGALLFDPETKMVFGEIDVGADNKPLYKRK